MNAPCTLNKVPLDQCYNSQKWVLKELLTFNLSNSGNSRIAFLQTISGKSNLDDKVQTFAKSAKSQTIDAIIEFMLPLALSIEVREGSQRSLKSADLKRYQDKLEQMAFIGLDLILSKLNLQIENPKCGENWDIRTFYQKRKNWLDVV